MDDVVSAGESGTACRPVGKRVLGSARALIGAATALLLLASGLGSTADASPTETYAGGYYGAGRIPPGCDAEVTEDKVCYHQVAGLNGLDSPVIDVAVLVPASPTAERDLRIARQAVESWQGGIRYLADQMGLGWLRDGVEFRITADTVDVADPTQSTRSLVDPEIVVVTTNPVGYTGIGTDPWSLLTPSLGIDDGEGQPCFVQEDPFSLASWERLPGFDSHHDAMGGTYQEDCGGVGGNTCFAVNAPVDPLPATTEVQGIYGLIQHEVGHCLTVGHVGDALDFSASNTPNFDIMSYSEDPAGLEKCVSTLDVETFATRMSRYLDVNADGQVSAADRLAPNLPMEDVDYHVQHPADYSLASSTGSAWDCPQPDLEVLPGATPTDFEPTPVRTRRDVLTVTSPTGRTDRGRAGVVVAGTVEQVLIKRPTRATSASADDPASDSASPLSELEALTVKVTDTEVVAVVTAAQLSPAGAGATPSYSVNIGGRDLHSYLDEQQQVQTYDWSGPGSPVLPTSWSVWDTTAGTVTFRIPRQWLAGKQVTAPYRVFASSTTGIAISTISAGWVRHDRAPDSGFLEVTGRPVAPPVNSVPARTPRLPSFETVSAYVGGRKVAQQDVTTAHGRAVFSLQVPLPRGARSIKVVWERRGKVVATAVRKVG